MADLPELSDSTKRKLALQWNALLDSNGLTGEHLQWHERDQHRRRHTEFVMAPGTVRDWTDPERLADRTGVRETVAVAEARFQAVSGEYWLYWLNSGNRYEVFVEWLEQLKRDVSAAVAAIWKGDSEIRERWYERACGPAIERTLSRLVREGMSRARDVELKRLTAGADQAGKKAESEMSITALKPWAEALKDAAEGGFPEAKSSNAPDFIRSGPERTTGALGDSAARNETGTDRREAVDAYIEEVFSRTGKRITRKDIWREARYKSRTEFERWERNDRRATRTAHQRFTKLLFVDKPHLK